MKTDFDIIIIGKGPAGVSASLYAQRAGRSTLLIGETSMSLKKAEKIENYYGLETPVSGEELFEIGLKQAEALGAEIVEDQVVGISWDGDYLVKTVKGQYKARSVIMATGVKRDTPKIDGLQKLEGLGVSYCAVCDGFFYREKPVAVLGSGEYALEEATHLKTIASKVTIVTDGVVVANKSLDFEYIEKKIKRIEGEGKVERLVFADDTTIDVTGVFVALGTAGSTDLAKKLGAQVDGRYIKVDEKMQTNLPGLYAAGDTTGGMLQVAKAVYEGAQAGMESAKFLRGVVAK